MKFVGIDVGSSSIKIVEIQQSKRGLQIHQFQEIPLGQNPAFDKELEVLEQLRAYSQTLDIDNTRICMALHQGQIVTRQMLFPFPERLKIQKSIGFELEEEIPFSFENACFDFKVNAYVGPQTRVIGAAVPKSHIEKAIKLAADGGADVHLLSCEGFALANLIEDIQDLPPQLPPENPDEPEVVLGPSLHLQIHIGHSHTLVNVFQQDRLIALRSLTFGNKEIISLLVKKYELPWVEAKKEFQEKAAILINKDGASYDQIAFSDTLAQGLKPLIHELKLTMIEVESDLKAKVSGISLSGGGAQIEHIHPFLTQNLGVVVNLAKYKLPLLSTNSSLHGQQLHRMGVALGLALEGARRPLNPGVNFLKGEYAKQNRKFTQLWDKWGQLAKVAAVFFIGFWVFAEVRLMLSESLLSKAQEQLRRQARQTAGLSVKQANEAAIRNYLKDQKRKIDQTKALTTVAKIPSSLDILKTLSDSLPQRLQLKMNLSELNIQGQRIEIIGSVANTTELSLLEAALNRLSTQTPQRLANVPVASAGVGFGYGIQWKADLKGATE